MTVAAAGEVDADIDIDIDEVGAEGIAVEADDTVDREAAVEAECDNGADADAVAAVEADRVTVELEVPSRASAYWTDGTSSEVVVAVLVAEKTDTAPHCRLNEEAEDSSQTVPMVSLDLILWKTLVSVVSLLLHAGHEE